MIKYLLVLSLCAISAVFGYLKGLEPITELQKENYELIRQNKQLEDDFQSVATMYSNCFAACDPRNNNEKK